MENEQVSGPTDGHDIEFSISLPDKGRVGLEAWAPPPARPFLRPYQEGFDIHSTSHRPERHGDLFRVPPEILRAGTLTDEQVEYRDAARFLTGTLKQGVAALSAEETPEQMHNWTMGRSISAAAFQARLVLTQAQSDAKTDGHPRVVTMHDVDHPELVGVVRRCEGGEFIEEPLRATIPVTEDGYTVLELLMVMIMLLVSGVVIVLGWYTIHLLNLVVTHYLATH